MLVIKTWVTRSRQHAALLYSASCTVLLLLHGLHILCLPQFVFAHYSCWRHGYDFKSHKTHLTTPCVRTVNLHPPLPSRPFPHIMGELLARAALPQHACAAASTQQSGMGVVVLLLTPNGWHRRSNLHLDPLLHSRDSGSSICLFPPPPHSPIFSLSVFVHVELCSKLFAYPVRLAPTLSQPPHHVPVLTVLLLWQLVDSGFQILNCTAFLCSASWRGRCYRLYTSLYTWCWLTLAVYFNYILM